MNKHISNLITKPESEISPLLKFYNELASNSGFRLPVKQLLEFDTRVFVKHLAKMKKAHDIEIRWVKKAAVQKASEGL